MNRFVWPILLTTVWINASELFRNEFLVKSYWVDHYRSMGLVFPSTPINGVLWGLWCLLLAIAILLLSRRFNLIETYLKTFRCSGPHRGILGETGKNPIGSNPDL